MYMEMDDSHDIQEASHVPNGRTTTMTIPSRCNYEMHGHVGSNVGDPMFEIVDVTMIE